MDLKSRIKDGVAALDRRARPWAERSKAHGWAYEFLLFGLKQAWACLFGALMLVLLVGTYLFWPHDALLARYDFLVIASVAIQALLILLKLERWDEAAVIAIFHLVGTAMEIFKTAHGSWIYPEASVLRIGDVPLFTGFMYACVGSYIARIWRLFDITFIRYPPFWSAHVLAVLIYLNFFTHHYVTDMRLGLFALSALLFGRTWFVFTPDRVARRMPMLLGLMLVALFIWLAENLGTAAGAWIYPSQREGWHMVPIEKLGAWYLLMTISFVLVSLVHRPLDACVERLREGIRGAV
ncbi:DUF817 domain-containing protein [Caulobacter flavus]|jgi:uncharacterized membrane protein YoaT (DUF817 family)|uniref:DUF817 domain-containing protein n=1 Tax=Caulobacter flavus TaxID=1679497 RepID=A0A2N5CR31_9CAUL|nr:DUF817 domain-containing protein [Caulobacter flavus]AYV45587.1 DUF817 domain-containing protein [Caulobacter flavus]PLR10627.1 DUF817 domain-containing protein [Caulobacter flavus]